MIAYEVTVDVDEALAERDRSRETRFRQRYMAESLGDLERYLEDHAPALRADFVGEFPVGVTVSREIWEEVARWSAEFSAPWHGAPAP